MDKICKAQVGDGDQESDAEPLELDSDCPETSYLGVGGSCDGGQYAEACQDGACVSAR